MTQFVYHKGFSDKDLSLPRFTAIWRYQDLPKLLWTLTTGCLWFARIDSLGDMYEGSITRAGHRKRAEMLKTMPGMGEPGGFRLPEVEAWISGINRAMVRNAAVNAWHIGDHESAAMWKLYVAAGQGVAIRSTIDRLI